MPFCANCGAQVEGRFCAKCGAAVGEAAAPPAGGAYQPPSGAGYAGQGGGSGYQAPGPGYPTAAPPPAASGMSENAASALSYVLGVVTGILFLVLEPYNRNRTVRFHAFQSIFLNIAWFVLWVAMSIFMGVMYRVGLWVLSILWPVFALVWFATWIYMIVTASQGRTVVLPIIGPLAQKQA